ncbi:MAG: ATP-binding protein [Candidatus Micrarchaeota archaeon]
MLIIICGLPGSGKSSFAKRLVNGFSSKLIYLSSDRIRKKIIKKPTYSEQEKKLIYDRMAEHAKKSLDMDGNVIVDATFYLESERKRFLKLAKQASAKAYIIVCTLSEEETRKRLKRRKNSLSDADFNVYLKLRKEFQPIKEKHIHIDSSLPVKNNITRVLEFIGDEDG